MTDSRKLTQRGRDRRHQLMAYAAMRFAEGGYHPTSVADIVAALGVGKGVFYWYFASKEELLTELLKSSNHELRKRQQQAIGDEVDPVRRIELGIRGSFEWFRAHRWESGDPARSHHESPVRLGLLRALKALP